MTLSVIFPADKQVEAEAYLTYLNDHNPDPSPGALWGILRQDRHGQHVVPFLGPDGHAGGQHEEPAGAEELRADGVLAPAVDWPEEEE